MDANELTKTAVAVVMPWLLETGTKALEKVQGQAVEGAAAAPARIYSWLREKLAPSKVAMAVLEELPANPKDETNQQTLELQLAKLLEANEGLRTELAALLPASPQGAQTMAGQTANQTGSGNKLAQVAGQGNTTNIS